MMRLIVVAAALQMGCAIGKGGVRSLPGKLNASKANEYAKTIDLIIQNNPNITKQEIKDALGENADSELMNAIESVSHGADITLTEAARRIELVAAVQHNTVSPNDHCSGFGIRLPVVAVRFRNYTSQASSDDSAFDAAGSGVPASDTVDIRGPVASGVGAGYHFSWACWPDYGSIGPNLFVFSQGFNPSTGEFQFGTGVGFQINVKSLFSFGIDVGYDLIRFESINGKSISNGLFSFKNLGGPSLSYMFTLEVGLGDSVR